MIPTLKAPGSKRFKLECDKLNLSFGFNSMLTCAVSRYTKGFLALTNMIQSNDANLDAIKVGRCALTPG